MYKIMLVDDEGITIDSMKYIIQKNFGDTLQIETAKTGRKAIELSEIYRPDIVFMDIQMPGINGLEAMREMKERNQAIVFVVVSAYDKFEYAKQAIDLGVLEYMTKPLNGNRITEVLRRAVGCIDDKRKKISNDLEIKEKLESVIPMLENGFIYSAVIQEESQSEVDNYRNLLEIREDYGYAMLIEFGDETKFGKLTNPVGASVRMQKQYSKFREIVKDFFDGIVGAVMGNRVTVFIPSEEPSVSYNTRIAVIEKARAMVQKLTQKLEMNFKVGIGSTAGIYEVQNSYKEAIEALRSNIGKVTHVKDLPVGCGYDVNYPVEVEKALFLAVRQGNPVKSREYARRFFDWMTVNSAEHRNSIQLKVLEFVMEAETEAFLHGGMKYEFGSRRNYLDAVMNAESDEEIKIWFLDKIMTAAQNVSVKQSQQTIDIIEQSKIYIEENYKKDLSLDEVSKNVNVSPYYFSKLFKEETGINFIDYLTQVRISNAQKLLLETQKSIKEICAEVGYSDPNYFSRLFKKQAGFTPSEYREGK